MGLSPLFTNEARPSLMKSSHPSVGSHVFAARREARSMSRNAMSNGCKIYLHDAAAAVSYTLPPHLKPMN